MNDKKKLLLFISAVMAILFGGLLFLNAIFGFTQIAEYVKDGRAGTAEFGAVILGTVFIVLFTAAFIFFGIMLHRNRTHTKFIITLIALFGVMTLIFIIGFTSALAVGDPIVGILGIIYCGAGLGITIAGLVLKPSPEKKDEPSEDESDFLS
ncbi:MAG: hypothetical protein FWH03_06945 [Firmicutes bacterium]|nr:hypothetical protein [Bacillota bacterium]